MKNKFWKGWTKKKKSLEYVVLGFLTGFLIEKSKLIKDSVWLYYELKLTNAWTQNTNTIIHRSSVSSLNSITEYHHLLYWSNGNIRKSLLICGYNIKSEYNNKPNHLVKPKQFFLKTPQNRDSPVCILKRRSRQKKKSDRKNLKIQKVNLVKTII